MTASLLALVALSSFGYINGGLCGVGFADDDFAVTATIFDDLANFEVATTIDKTRAAAAAHDRAMAALHRPEARAKTFALLLVDGLSMREEQLVSAVANALADTPLVGGSAGDDLNFRSTWILADGRFVANAAVLMLVGTRRRFAAFKTEPAHLLVEAHEKLDCDVFVASNEKEARARVIEAIPFIEGLRPIDAGTLYSARAIERMTVLAIGINRRYKIKSACYRVMGMPSV